MVSSVESMLGLTVNRQLLDWQLLTLCRVVVEAKAISRVTKLHLSTYTSSADAFFSE